MSLPCLEVVQLQVVGVGGQQIDVTETDIGAIAEIHARVDLVSPRAVHTPRVVELQLMPVAEIVTDVRARVYLEIRRVFLVRESRVGVLDSTRPVFVARL